MKKGTMLVCTMVAVFAASSTAAAQLPGVSVGIAAGPTIPVGHLSDEANVGVNVTGSLGWNVPLLPVGFRADLFFQNLPDKESGSFREFGGMVNGLVTLGMGVLRPYMIGGVGAVNHSAPDVQHAGHEHAGESGTNFGYNIGGGLRFGLGTRSGFVEARLIDSGSERRTVPVVFGITF